MGGSSGGGGRGGGGGGIPRGWADARTAEDREDGNQRFKRASGGQSATIVYNPWLAKRGRPAWIVSMEGVRSNYVGLSGMSYQYQRRYGAKQAAVRTGDAWIKRGILPPE